MKKKAIIFDLDNTIYPVASIAAELFTPLFQMIEEEGSHHQHMAAIKADLMRRPFQLVAAEHKFSKELAEKGREHLSQVAYTGKIKPFEDYADTKDLSVDKFLVTTGFPRLQQSKIDGMKIAADFKEIHIVDPGSSGLTKKDVFAGILERHHYNIADVLVIGDDLESEIKAAQALGIDVVLYDSPNVQQHVTNIPRIEHFSELRNFI